MRAYKGFNKYLECTMGKGVFKYEPGIWYREDKARCANTGFHATYNPLDVLEYYNQKDSRYFIVELRGNIDEDAINSRISAPEICLVKEITKQQLIIAGIQFMINNPKLPWSGMVTKDYGRANGDGYVIVRGEEPRAEGEKGDTLYMLKEDAAGFEAAAYVVGVDVPEHTICTVKGEIVDAKERP